MRNGEGFGGADAFRSKGKIAVVVVYVGRFGGTLCDLDACDRLVPDRLLLYPLDVVMAEEELLGSTGAGESTDAVCTKETNKIMHFLWRYMMKTAKIMKYSSMALRYENGSVITFGLVVTTKNIYYWVMSEHTTRTNSGKLIGI